jgi:hypothetical protein
MRTLRLPVALLALIAALFALFGLHKEVPVADPELKMDVAGLRGLIVVPDEPLEVRYSRQALGQGGFGEAVICAALRYAPDAAQRLMSRLVVERETGGLVDIELPDWVSARWPAVIKRDPSLPDEIASRLYGIDAFAKAPFLSGFAFFPEADTVILCLASR